MKWMYSWGIFCFLLLSITIVSCSEKNKAVSGPEKKQSSVAEKSMTEELEEVMVDSLATECDCVDAILKVTDLMLDILEKRNVQFDLVSISADSIASKEMKMGHKKFQKIISKCIYENGLTQEMISSCPNYEQANANTVQLKALKLK